MYFNIKANDLQFRCTKLGKWCKKQWITHRLFHYSWTEVLIFVYQRRVESHDLRNILCWKSIANQLSRSNLGFQTGRHDLNVWRIFMEIHIFLLQPSNPKCFIVSPVKLKIELAWPNTTLHSLYFCHKVHKMYFSKICGLKPTFIQHCFPFPIASQGK